MQQHAIMIWTRMLMTALAHSQPIIMTVMAIASMMRTETRCVMRTKCWVARMIPHAISTPVQQMPMTHVRMSLPVTIVMMFVL